MHKIVYSIATLSKSYSSFMSGLSEEPFSQIEKFRNILINHDIAENVSKLFEYLSD